MSEKKSKIKLTDYAKEMVNLLEMRFSKGQVGELFRWSLGKVYDKVPYYFAGKEKPLDTFSQFKDFEKYKKFQNENRKIKKDKGRSFYPAEVTQDHVVPICVILQHWKDHKEKLQNEKWVKTTLDKALHVCLLTKDENEMLNKNNLKNVMPEDWEWKAAADESYFYARYNKVGIKV